MSFILDALRKSETERQRQASPGLVAAAHRPPAPRRSIWVPVLVVALMTNLALLAWLWWRDRPAAESAPLAAESPPPPPPPVQPPLARAPAASPSLAAVAGISPGQAPPPNDPQTQAADERFAEAPVEQQYTEVLDLPPDATDAAGEASGGDSAAGTSGPPAHIRSAALPTVNDLVARGAFALPELHLDIHVFSAAPAERFVFINMKKYTEGTALAEGPRVEEITPDGVTLSHNGQRFVLTRD